MKTAPLFLAGALVAACSRPVEVPVKAAPEAADLVLMGARVVTMAGHDAEAVAVRAGRIAYVGTAAHAQRFIGPDTRVEHVQGLVVPGFVDAHMHFARLGKRARELFVDEPRTPEGVAAIVRAAAAKAKPGEWIVGKGWHTAAWSEKTYPHRRLLDDAAPLNPVYLVGMASHAAWVNSAALRIAGVRRRTKAPVGGEILRGPDGAPTGVLLESAASLVRSAIPADEEEQVMADLKTGIRTAQSFGITQIHDMSVDDASVRRYRALHASGDLGVRLHVMRYVDDADKDLARVLATPPTTDGATRLSVRGIKVFADGALGARGAALLEPYADARDTTGLVQNDATALKKIVSQATRAGYQIAVHAIGDRGNRNVLDAIEHAHSLGLAPERPRIEHAQVLSLEDIARFRELGVIASMQPIHAVLDKGFAEERLGPSRMQGAYAWKTLLDGGVTVVASADTPSFPVAYSNPLWGYYAAVTRADHQGRPAGGWYPEQRVDRMQALRMYTIDAAYAGFAEHETGSLEAGKLADITVLSRDITRIPAPDILKTSVTMTIVGGDIVYRNN